MILFFGNSAGGNDSITPAFLEGSAIAATNRVMNSIRLSNPLSRAQTKLAKPVVLFCLFVSFAFTAGDSCGGEFEPNPNAGLGDVIVCGKFGGSIFGFEVDPNGTEALLCEALGLNY